MSNILSSAHNADGIILELTVLCCDLCIKKEASFCADEQSVQNSVKRRPEIIDISSSPSAEVRPKKKRKAKINSDITAFRDRTGSRRTAAVSAIQVWRFNEYRAECKGVVFGPECYMSNKAVEFFAAKRCLQKPEQLVSEGLQAWPRITLEHAKQLLQLLRPIDVRFDLQEIEAASRRKYLRQNASAGPSRLPLSPVPANRNPRPHPMFPPLSDADSECQAGRASSQPSLPTPRSQDQGSWLKDEQTEKEPPKLKIIIRRNK